MDNNEKKKKVTELCLDIEKVVHNEIDNPNTPYKDYFPFELIYMIVAATYENALLRKLSEKLPQLQNLIPQQQGLHLVPISNDPGPVFPFENVPVTQIPTESQNQTFEDVENLQEFEGKGKILHFKPKNNISN